MYVHYVSNRTHGELKGNLKNRTFFSLLFLFVHTIRASSIIQMKYNAFHNFFFFCVASRRSSCWVSDADCCNLDMSCFNYLFNCDLPFPLHDVQLQESDEIYPYSNSYYGNCDTCHFCCCDVWNWWLYQCSLSTTFVPPKKCRCWILCCCSAHQPNNSNWSITSVSSVLYYS